MNRKEFILKAGLGTCGIVLGSSLISSCSTTQYLSLEPKSEGVWEVPISAFFDPEKEKNYQVLILELKGLNAPVALEKLDQGYQAILMQCTHKGCTVNRGGGMFTCPCHGSEFDAQGKVLEGPAQKDLLKLTTQIEDEKIILSLP